MNKEEIRAHMQVIALHDKIKTLHRKCLMALSPKTVGDLLTELEATMHDGDAEMIDRLIYGLALTAAIGIMLEALKEPTDAQ